MIIRMRIIRILSRMIMIGFGKIIAQYVILNG